MPPGQIACSAPLLVEGKDGLNFFRALCRKLEASVQIHDFGGVEELGPFLRAFVALPGFETVARMGIVRDAESSASSALQSVQSLLANVDLPVPARPGSFADGKPSVGALILPPGEGAGMLETLLARSFAGTPMDACIDAFLGCAEAAGATFARPEKSRTAAYLAATDAPHVSVGVAAQQGVWKFDHAVFKPLRDFLDELADQN